MIKEKITPGIPGLSYKTHTYREREYFASAFLISYVIHHDYVVVPLLVPGRDRYLLYLFPFVPHPLYLPACPDHPSHTGFYIQHTRPCNMNTAIVSQRPSNSIYWKLNPSPSCIQTTRFNNLLNS